MSNLLLSGKKKPLDEVSKKLIDIGVSVDALGTTLVQEGREDLRQLILSRKENAHAQNSHILFYPKPSKNKNRFLCNAYQCNLIYNLFLKECWLAGFKIRQESIVDLSRKQEALFEHVYDYSNVFPFLFVPDFYPRNTNFMFSRPETIEELSWFFRTITNQYGISIVAQSISPIEEINEQVWSPFLLAQFKNKGLCFGVEGGKKCQQV